MKTKRCLNAGYRGNQTVVLRFKKAALDFQATSRLLGKIECHYKLFQEFRKQT